MASITVKIDDSATLSTGSPVSITGKNGYTTIIGSIPFLVNSVSLVDTGGEGIGNIEFTISTLDNTFDDNFQNTVLNTNDSGFGGLKGLDHISIPIEEKLDTSGGEGFVAFGATITQYSANIVGHATNTIKVENTPAGAANLIDSLPATPFYASISQLIDTRFFSNKIAFVAGSRFDVEREYNVSGGEAHTFSANVGVIPRDKIFIRVFVDEIEITAASFSWDEADIVDITLDGTEKIVRTKVDYYTVPTIEPGDNISLFAQNTYAITNASYSTESVDFNVALTTNCIYKIRFEDSITANVSGTTIVNISDDISGFIGNIDTGANTFTVDYSEATFPGLISLANNMVYNIDTSLNFKPISLGQDRIIEDVPAGINIVRARNRNSTGRLSPFATKSVNIISTRIKRVNNLLISEALYKDTSQGVAVRITIEFDHITDQEVVAYEVSYKLNSNNSDLQTFTTVQLPAAGVDSDGKIRFVITNINRGRTSAINSITVRVTPIAGADVRGVSVEKTMSILGKTLAPQNIINLRAGQSDFSLIFVWQIPTNADGTVVDLDLNEVEVRRKIGIITEEDFLASWPLSDKIETISTPATSFIRQIDQFGEQTFLFRTKDTSGNLSEVIKGISLVVARPILINTFKAWNEDDPSTNFVTGIINDNIDEFNYPSFANSNNGGLSSPITSSVDNANGTSSGWAVLVNPTDLFADINASYQTQVRNVGESVTGTVFTDITGSQAISTTWNAFRETIIQGVTETLSQANILVETDFTGIGTILGFNNVNAAIVSYNAENKTLVSGSSSGNIFALWNSGQFANDISNANSFALIAGIVNANAVALGNTYFADGKTTGSNNWPNLVSNAITYELVDLSQYIDESGQITFLGATDTIVINTEIRVANATVDLFYANSNVNVSAFVNGGSNDGWKVYSGSEDTFQHFQLRYTVTNQAPDTTDYTLDKFRYTLDLRKKTFQNLINVNNHPTAVDYSSAGFTNVPRISIIPLSNQSLAGTYIESSPTGANIAVFDTVTGTANTDVFVDFTAEGV